ncbi:DUF885 domain-containing protein [Massilia cavernae]|uniref:DUF885 domain-containing protein n=1 Tax=Massilia cavernae TaxID=2320864 RepID=A0A418XAH8_9BURK|nr:DUF885 domain-containing protein [Massilia cavernae]RJG09457.1 DUF885 domain-containing protein [Massilia cavernae]
MIKTKIALALLLTSFALAPAGAAKPKKQGKAKVTKTVKGKAGKAKAPVAKGKSSKAKAVPAAAAAVAIAAAQPAANDRAQDRRFNTQSMQFLAALWKIDPDSAIVVGKYEGAATLVIPSAATRAQQLAFANEWLEKFGKFDTRKLSDKQRTDLALLVNKLESDRWYLTTFKEYEWNPSLYNIAQPIDLVLTTPYASKAQRLRTLLKRIEHVPAYFAAAQASIRNPTHEHTQLAITQAPGTLAVLADLGKEAQDSTLTPAEKNQFASRIANAGHALIGYVDFLAALDKQQQAAGTARSFRIGKALYEPKFRHDIQAGSSAEQTYQKALAAREQLLTRMDALSDELWAETMGSTPKPADRTRKIGMVIDKLSANHVSREEFFPEIRRQIPQLQEWVTTHNLLTLDPKKPLVVRETPMYQRGIAGASIDAPGPYRPQDRTYYNVTPLDGMTPEQAESSLREYNHWMLQILNIHEAIPGHYAQLVYANKSPSLVKSLFGNGAMVEGWAVYGERMMLESGYGGNTPEMWLMWSKWNLRVVTNTILDYSVHVLGISEAEGLDMLVRQAFQTRSEAAEKWHRAKVSSVQLTSYFSGYSEIMDLREERKQALGPRFDLKAFHEQFLSYGSAPVPMIRELMQ